ncbi:Scavenger receptor class B member 1 [Danaus plexippus plexippus]|uniref:Scavenger receptor class B member 1 n=1 Tax=Danaus plexippus plexippus TaxID=278856 RepID=A0A212FCS4_DANPL|nr:Scavenger receptor class B member 1 [Danaus plexippus plexippus]
MKPKNPNYKHAEDKKKNYVLMALGILFVVLPIVTLFVDPVLMAMKYLTRMSVGSKIYTMMKEEIPGALINVYIFNITNGEAFVSGEDYKLKVEQVGPFVYQEFRTNEGFEIDEEAGVMRYTPIAAARFMPERSIADPRHVNITVINTIMLALASMLSSYSIFGKSGYNLLINQLQSKPFLNIDVDSYFWGYDDPLIALGNTLMPGWITFQRLGILDRLYDPAAVPRLELGIHDEDKFNIRTANGCPGLKVWQYENPSKRSRCNTFTDAYEGFAFPPGLTPDRALRLYRNVFCRMLELRFVDTKPLDFGPESFVYQIRNDSFAVNAETNCLCGEYGCAEGLSSAAPCLFGFDLGLSFGHFWNAYPKVYERIEGMRPDEKEHGSEFLIDPKSGAVLAARFTLQLNLIVRDVSYNSLTKPFSEMVIPMTYLKIVQPPLPNEAKNVFRFMYQVLPNIILGLQIIIFVIGFIMIAYTVRSIYWQVIVRKGIDLLNASNEDRVHVPRSETLLVEEKPLDEYRLYSN